MTALRWILVSCVGLVWPVGASAQMARTATAPHTMLEVVADTAAPGTDTWVGVRFKVEPGWHIYWRNPGESGAPPMLLWTPPAGVTVGDIEWPMPERIPYGPLVNYGYHGDVVLPVRIKATKVPTDPILLSATWMVCRDVCVQAKGRVALTFPLPADAVADGAKRIAEARARVPVAAPKGWKANGLLSGAGVDVSVDAATRLSAEMFFPIDEGVIDPAAPITMTPSARGVRFTLALSKDQTKTPSSLRGVLVLVDGRAFEIDVPIRAQRVAPGTPR